MRPTRIYVNYQLKYFTLNFSLAEDIRTLFLGHPDLELEVDAFNRLGSNLDLKLYNIYYFQDSLTRK